jgi:hypothetical protein
VIPILYTAFIRQFSKVNTTSAPGNTILSCNHHVQKSAERRVHRNRASPPILSLPIHTPSFPPSTWPPLPPNQLTRRQDTGNKVSRRSQIIGTTNIILGGKTVIQAEVIIRGDLLRTYPASNPNEKQSGNQVAVAIGRYCFFSRGCELRPPGKLYKGYVFPGCLSFLCFSFALVDKS